MDGSLAGIAGRTLATEFGPGIEISNGIDNATAELAIDRPGAKTAMLFERAGRKVERVREFDADATQARWESEVDLWESLWRKPQAVMWSKLGLEFEVAAYVRCFIESTGPDSNAGLKTAALRMAAEIGLSLPGMHSLRWKFAEDEVAAKRESTPAPTGKSARDRLRVISGG